MDEPRKRFATIMSGPDIQYDLCAIVANSNHGANSTNAASHGLFGRRMPDLNLVTANGPLRVFTLLHTARPVLLNLGVPDSFDITPWAQRVQSYDATYAGTWELRYSAQFLLPPPC